MNTQSVEPATIKDRLERLPHVKYKTIKDDVLSRASVSSNTYYEVLRGDSENHEVLYLLSQVLGCTIEQVRDPNYQFE